MWACLSVFAALFALRAWDVHRHFFLLGEQIRDWSVALGPLASLPLTGAPSTLGGHGLGPIYYWILWAIRVTIGPAFGNLPHAAGVGLAALQSAADAFLFLALWRRVQSAWLAAAAVALAAAGPFDAGMATLIWNPPVANLLAKTAMGLFLIGKRGSRPMLYATMATAWMALQAHSTGVFVAAPLFGWLVGREIVARQWRAAGVALRTAFDCILVLQIPYAVHLLTRPASDAGIPGTRAFAGFAALSRGPWWTTAVRSWEALTSRADFLLLQPWSLPVFGWIIAAAAALIFWRARRDPALLVVTVLPIAMATMVFAPWEQPQTYWFLVVMPPVATTLVLGLTAFAPPRVARAAAIALLAALVAAAPVRYRASQNATFFRFPDYGSLLRGSRDIVRRQPDIRDIRTEFELPPSTDRLYLFQLLGGRLNPAGAFVAIVAADGSVGYVRAPQ